MRKIARSLVAPHLPPEEAARRFDEDPTSVLFALHLIPVQFGITPDELLAELRAGHIVAEGVPNETGGYDDVAVNGAEMARWLDSDTPSAKKARAYFKERRQ